MKATHEFQGELAEAQADTFEPTLPAALARLAAVRPGDYARSRNHLDGAVTRLSPYITHGFLSLPQVLAHLRARHRLDSSHKLVFELAWREYFQHVWQHLGHGIFESLHAGVMPEDTYSREVPDDIRRAATGVPVIDQAVRTLYRSGYLHNHARMWLASYTVHLRKVHWRAGADWMVAHLLDGDLASNHLSWQWVAGTGSHKPYLFNADNVARYAPAPWHSPGTVIDQSYTALEQIARSAHAVVGGCNEHGVDEPALLTQPPPDVLLATTPPPSNAWLVHPWALREAPHDSLHAGTAARPTAGVFVADFHARWPWTARRWQFVAARMAQLTTSMHWLTAPPAANTRCFDEPHLRPYWSMHEPLAVPRLFAQPSERCASFMQFYTRVAGSLPP